MRRFPTRRKEKGINLAIERVVVKVSAADDTPKSHIRKDRSGQDAASLGRLWSCLIQRMRKAPGTTYCEVIERCNMTAKSRQRNFLIYAVLIRLMPRALLLIDREHQASGRVVVAQESRIDGAYLQARDPSYALC
jgi:hypothetical protein